MILWSMLCEEVELTKTHCTCFTLSCARTRKYFFIIVVVATPQTLYIGDPSSLQLQTSDTLSSSHSPKHCTLIQGQFLTHMPRICTLSQECNFFRSLWHLDFQIVFNTHLFIVRLVGFVKNTQRTVGEDWLQ